MTAPVIISSRSNDVIQELRDLRDPSAGVWVFLEGFHLVEEALKSHWPIDQLIVIPAHADADIAQAAAKVAKRTIQVTPYVFKTLSDVDAPQGILVVCRQITWDWSALLGKSPAPLVILDGLQDPGNAGAIVRTSEAAGVAGIITTPATARLFSPKALRGATGSSLRVPSMEHQEIQEIGSKLDAAGYSLLGASAAPPNQPSADILDDGLWTVNWKKPWAIVLGQEGQGLASEWESQTIHRISIPMQSPVESLNVAAAAAVLLYESFRYRMGKP